jgi:hypothetical protein
MGVDLDRVMVEKRPHDCGFLAAPLGAEYCEYEREVSTIQWATSQTGNPIISYDDGKTWTTFTPGATDMVPKVPTVQKLLISWKKVDN